MIKYKGGDLCLKLLWMYPVYTARGSFGQESWPPNLVYISLGA